MLANAITLWHGYIHVVVDKMVLLCWEGQEANELYVSFELWKIVCSAHHRTQNIKLLMVLLCWERQEGVGQMSCMWALSCETLSVVLLTEHGIKNYLTESRAIHHLSCSRVYAVRQLEHAGHWLASLSFDSVCVVITNVICNSTNMATNMHGRLIIKDL